MIGCIQPECQDSDGVYPRCFSTVRDLTFDATGSHYSPCMSDPVSVSMQITQTQPLLFLGGSVWLEKSLNLHPSKYSESPKCHFGFLH